MHTYTYIHIYINTYIDTHTHTYDENPLPHHTANTNICVTTTKLSRLYMQPPNKQLPCVIIINVLQIVFYHLTTIR